jgi:hypothetical protein
MTRSWPFLNFAGFIFIAYVGREEKRWPLGGIFELPTQFITNDWLKKLNLKIDY